MQGSAREKKSLSICGFTVLIRENYYETAVTYIHISAVLITSPPKTITDPLKELKMVKTDPKSQISFLLVPPGTIAQLLMKKKLPTSQSL